MTSLFDVRRAARLRNARLSDDRPISDFFARTMSSRNLMIDDFKLPDLPQ